MTSVEVVGVEGGKTFLSVLYNGKPFHVPPAALNLVDAAIARVHTGNTRLSLTTVNHPLPRTDTDKVISMPHWLLGQRFASPYEIPHLAGFTF